MPTLYPSEKRGYGQTSFDDWIYLCIDQIYFHLFNHHSPEEWIADMFRLDVERGDWGAAPPDPSCLSKVDLKLSDGFRIEPPAGRATVGSIGLDPTRFP